MTSSERLAGVDTDRKKLMNDMEVQGNHIGRAKRYSFLKVPSDLWHLSVH